MTACQNYLNLERVPFLPLQYLKISLDLNGIHLFSLIYKKIYFGRQDARQNYYYDPLNFKPTPFWGEKRRKKEVFHV